ncbi:helix-turn-helix domain-containing protein [Streptomyces sp. NRRL B-24484]|uniref:AlbA family DNA-binding domain-containing protein n=1 Tax=Streptomyces sp. NRRL B-24484 TaxID=1463833 RepID=UPI0004C106A7|nr:ATP-binding protein [Streptomyces sp. NRRL B-24484]
MSLQSRTDVVSALVEGDPDRLLGTAENAWLDFKTTPYALHTEKGKFELAKDVAAFANAQGGIIVCGVQTVPLEAEAKDVATKLTHFPRTLVKLQAYRDVVGDLVHPPVALSFNWYSAPGSEETGYLVIEVEALPEQARYALVRKMISDNDRMTEGWCVPVRHDDQTIFVNAHQIYYLINTTLQARSGPPAVAVTAPGVDPAEGRRELAEVLGADDAPVLFWQSTPSSPLSDFLEQLHRPDGIRHRLMNQDSLRGEVGFNFVSSYAPPKPHEGGLLIADSRRALYVRADGSVVAAAKATEDMLCWAMDRMAGAEQLNVIALSEMNLEYFRWVDRFLLPLASGPWEHRITAEQFVGERPRRLAPGHNPQFPLLGLQYQASSNVWTRAWVADGAPETDAYRSLSNIYGLFGLAASQNPYITDGRVDTAKVRAATHA